MQKYKTKSNREILTDILEHAKELKFHINTLKDSVQRDIEKSSNSAGSGYAMAKSFSFPITKDLKKSSRNVSSASSSGSKSKYKSRTNSQPISNLKTREEIRKSKSLNRDVRPQDLYLLPVRDYDGRIIINQNEEQVKKKTKKKSSKKMLRNPFRKKNSSESSEDNFYYKNKSGSDSSGRFKAKQNFSCSSSDDNRKVVEVEQPNFINLNYKNDKCQGKVIKIKKVKSRRSSDEKLEKMVLHVQKENTVFRKALRKRVPSS